MDKAYTFTGRWISSPTMAALTPVNVFHRQLEPFSLPEDGPENQHILFRRHLQYAGGKAILRLSADDYYKLYINGTLVCMGPTPGYPDHYYYDEVDVTPYLTAGDNVIAVHTYYQGLINRVWVSGDRRHGLIADLTVEGNTVLTTDECWVQHLHTGYVAGHKIAYDTQFAELYDSRAAEVGFEQPSFDDSGWERAALCDRDTTLYRNPVGNMEIEAIAPTAVEQRGHDLIIDFGGMYVGYLSATATGHSGDQITVRCGQELNPDGSVRHKLRANCVYDETWTLSGGRDTLWWFDYKSFRYAQLTLPEGVAVSDIKLLSRHRPFTLTANPRTADPSLLSIWELCVRSLRYGVQDTLMDCMEREKGQYVGDGVMTSATLAVLTGDTAVLERLMADSLRSRQFEGGLLTCTTCAFCQEIAEYPLMLPWLFAVHYALKQDTAFLAEHYDGMIAVLECYRRRYEKQEPGFLYDLDKWCVVDWPEGSRDGYDYRIVEGQVTPGTHNVICAYYIGAIKTMNWVAGKIGRQPYRDAAPLEQAYFDAYYDGDRHLFRDAKGSSHVSLPGNALPMMLGLCPEPAFATAVAAMLREKRLKTTNIFSSFMALGAAKRMGDEALLDYLLGDEDAWLTMLAEDATATFEAFGKDKKWNTSLFHLALTHAALFLANFDV